MWRKSADDQTSPYTSSTVQRSLCPAMRTYGLQVQRLNIILERKWKRQIVSLRLNNYN